MKKLYLPIGAFVLLYSVLVLASIYSQGFLVFELFSMLLPYWIILSVLIIIALFLLNVKAKLHFSKLVLKNSLILMLIVIFLQLNQFYSFSFIHPPQGKGSQNLQIAFLNKLYSNTEYSEIDQQITKVNPDLIGFAEMKNVDRPKITALKNYPYWFSKDARDGATISFYSKFPTTQNSDAPKFRYVLPLKMDVNGSELEVFVIHPQPPISGSWLNGRNEELNQLSAFINTLPKEKVLVLGDFNLSPWSATYRRLTVQLSTLKDSARGSGLQFSWHGAFINTQIDHIFVPNSAKIIQ